VPTRAKSIPSRLSRWSFDDVKTEPTVAQGGHHEPAPFVWRIRLAVAPAAERYRLVQVDGPTLRALDDVMDV